MSVAAERPVSRPLLGFFSQGFRPFFFAAGLWSILALALWIAMFSLDFDLPSRFDKLSWHIHEMLFGFVMAAIAGFLLTAIPNWTKRLPVSGPPLVLLVGLWLLGRIVCLISALLPAWLAIAADLSFPVMLAAVAAREIIAGRNWRNLPMTLPVVVLGIANLLMHLESVDMDIPPGLGWRLGLAAIIILISVVGGRIIPNFTRNWLAKRSVERLPKTFRVLDRAALAFLHTGLLAWAFFPDFAPGGVALLIGAALNFGRLLGWRGSATLAEPLLFILHIGYAWLVFGVTLLAFTVIGLDVALSAAVHALTAGAAGTMILAVMTRATRGHTGRALVADRVTSAIYILVTLAAVTRVAAALAGAEWMMPLLIASASFWIASFAGFLLSYAPTLTSMPNGQTR